MRKAALAGSAIIIAAVLAPLAPAAADDDEVSIPTAPERPSPGSQPIDLIAPIKEQLSGRAWLMAEGIDPGLQRRPGWDTLTRMDWRALNEVFAAPDAPFTQQSPSLQGPGGGGALVPFRDPSPAFSRDVLVTRDFSQSPYQTEPHLAVNPNDPDHIVLGTIDYNFPSVSSYVSLDGGSTWEGPAQAPYLLDDRTSGGDPVIQFDRDGNVYFASISIGVEEFTFGPIVTFLMVSSISVAHSDDGGFSWPETVSTARSEVRTEDLRLDPLGRLRGTLVSSFLDKPWMTTGPHPDDPSQDSIYLTYTDFELRYEILWVGEVPTFQPTAQETTIRLVRSDDQARTWTDPVAVSPTVQRAYGEVDEPITPGRIGTKRTVQGSQPVVDPDGTVHVAWLDTTDSGAMEGDAEIHAARSDDGGENWSNSTVAAEFNEAGFRPRTAFFRYWGSSFPQVAAGPDGELYIVYVGRPDDRPNDDGDVFLVRSLDGGRTWDDPVRVNDDHASALQFFPAVDTSPDGAVHVMWGDMRDDPAQTRYHIYYTQSEDQGETFGAEVEDGIRVGDSRVTDFASNPNVGFPFGLFIGDYFAIEATDTDVYLVWADTRLGEFGPINQKIGFTRQRAMTAPEIFVSPPAGPGGQHITIQGFDFQPNLDVVIQLGDSSITTARTNADGRFETNVYVPVTSEGAQALRASDNSGNFAQTSFYTEFGFGDIERLYDDLANRVGVVADAPRIDELVNELQEVRDLLAVEQEQLAARSSSTVSDWVAPAIAVLLLAGGGTAWAIRRNNHNHSAAAAPAQEGEQR